jgi:hypothetical protein
MATYGNNYQGDPMTKRNRVWVVEVKRKNCSRAFKPMMIGGSLKREAVAITPEINDWWEYRVTCYTPKGGDA